MKNDNEYCILFFPNLIHKCKSIQPLDIDKHVPKDYRQLGHANVPNCEKKN